MTNAPGPGEARVFVRRRGHLSLPNGTVHDPRLSYAALGVLAVLLSRKDGARGGYRAMMGRGLGETAMRRALRELADLGYRHMVRRRAADGRWVTDTVVSEEPITHAEAVEWLTGTADPVDGPVDGPVDEGVDKGDRAVESQARSDLRKHRKPAGGTVQRRTTARSAVARSGTALLRTKVSSLRSETEETTAAKTECVHGYPDGATLMPDGHPRCPLCRAGARF